MRPMCLGYSILIKQSGALSPFFFPLHSISLCLPPSQPWLAATYLMTSSKWLFLCPSRVSMTQTSMNTRASACDLSSACKARSAKLEVMFHASQSPQVSHASSLQWIERYVSQCCSKCCLTSPKLQFLCNCIRCQPDLALVELQTELREICDIEVSVDTIARSLQREGYTMKTVRTPFSSSHQYSHH
jgi:hypothetical protein